MDHAFNTTIAQDYDVNIAILIADLKYWTYKNLISKNNIHNGLCWTYNTVQALSETFPYWTRHQIEHLLKKAEVNGLIVSGNFNHNKYDRTKWYAITPIVYKYYDELQSDIFLERLYSSISEKSEMHESLKSCISEISEMDLEVFRNVFRRFPKPIPDTDPDTDPYTKKKNIKKKKDFDFEDEELSSTETGTTKSDYSANYTEIEDGHKQAIEATTENTKSGYRNNRAKKSTDLKNNDHYGLKDILQNNPHQVPEQLIRDWIKHRKAKRAGVSQTSWDSVNQKLSECIDRGLNPIEILREHISTGYQKFNLEWYVDQHKTSSNNRRPSSSWDAYMAQNQQNGGNTYDQYGNAYDPLG
jgi:hypothetical protein